MEVREGVSRGGSKGGGSRGVARTAATTVRLPRLRRLQCVRGGRKQNQDFIFLIILFTFFFKCNLLLRL